VGIITATIVEAVFGFAPYVLASVRAVVSVMINNIVYQASIKNLRENRMQAGFVGIEREGHCVFPKNLSIGGTLHVIWVERVRTAYEVVVTSFGIQLVSYICLKKVKISLVFIIPSTVKTEIFGESSKKHIGLCRGRCWGGCIGWRESCGKGRRHAGQRSEGGAGFERRRARWAGGSGAAGRKCNVRA